MLLIISRIYSDVGVCSRSLAIHEGQEKILAVAAYTGDVATGCVTGAGPRFCHRTVYLYLVLNVGAQCFSFVDSHNGAKVCAHRANKFTPTFWFPLTQGRS